MLARTWSNRNSHLLLVVMHNGTAMLKKVWQFLKKLNILLPHHPEIALLSIYPNELENHAHTKTHT